MLRTFIIYSESQLKVKIVFVGPCHHVMARPQVADGETAPIWRVAANKLNKQSRTADKGWSSSFAVGRGANNSSPSKILLRNTHGRDVSSGDKTIRR